MAEQVGSIYYSVTLDTAEMIAQQRKVDGEIQKTTKSLDGFEARLNQVAKAVASYAAALYVVAQTDAFTKINAQLKLATDNTRDLAQAQAQVKRIAQEAQTDIGGVATLYARISQSSETLRANQAKVAEITRVVALALKVSGAGAQEAASATLQLSQAFASGVLRGEEFNAVSEAAPRLMRALADGIGVPVGQLRAMAEQGRLTSEVLAGALPKALGGLEQEAKQVQTIGGAFQQLRNEMLLFIGEQATASGAAQLTAAAITTLASNIDGLAAAAYGFAAAKLAAILLDGGAAAAAAIKAALAHVASLQAERAAAIAVAEAQVQKAQAQLATLAATKEAIVLSRAQALADLEVVKALQAKGLSEAEAGIAMGATKAATVAATQADVERTAATLANLRVTQAAIITSREQYVTELQLMQGFQARGIQMARIGEATTQLALLGAQQTRVTAAMTEAEIAHAAAVRANTSAMQMSGAVVTELAVLGRQQAAVTAQQAAATAALTAAQSGLAKATTAAGTASRLASSALGLLGGPIGLVTTALGLGVTAWMLWGDASEDHEARAQDAVERSTEEIVSDLDKQINKLKERNALAAAGLPDVAKQETDSAKRLATLQGQINDLQSGKGVNGGGPLPEVSRVALIQALMRQYGELTGKVQQVNEEQDKLAAAGTSSKLTQWMTKYATDAERVTAEIAKAKKELGSAFTPELEQKIRQKVDPPKKPQKTPAEKFDSEAYLAGLRKAQASEITVINETEVEKLRIAKKSLADRKISEKEYADAVTLINSAAEKDRQELMAKTQADIDRDRKQANEKALADWKKHAEEMQRAMEFGAQLTKAVNPVDALRQEYEAKLQLVRQYEELMAAAGVDATAQGQLARTQITNEYELQRQALAEQTFRSQGESQAFLIDSLNALSSTASSAIMGLINGTMTAQQVMQSLANTVLNEAVQSLVQIGVQQVKNALVADTIAAADQAKRAANGAVYTASVAAQVTGMAAMAAQNAFAATAAIPIVGPALAPAAAAAAGAAAAALGAPAVVSAPLAGARQYGGPTSAGSLYRVNETGRPEMFTAGNGNQYMLPTKDGRVTAANKVGGGNAVSITQNISVGAGASYADVQAACAAAKAEAKAEILYSMNNRGMFSQ